jgi:hypothetical protein
MRPTIARAGAEIGLVPPYRDPPLPLRISGWLFIDTADRRPPLLDRASAFILRAFMFGRVRQLDRVMDRSLARAWEAGAGPDPSAPRPQLTTPPGSERSPASADHAPHALAILSNRDGAQVQAKLDGAGSL